MRGTLPGMSDDWPTVAELAAEEDELQLDGLDENQAWALGVALVEEARRRLPEFAGRPAFIGWGLRDYARTDPDWVWAQVDRLGDRLSGLSRREASKHRER